MKTDLPCAFKREWWNVEMKYFVGCASVFTAFSVSIFFSSLTAVGTGLYV